MNTPPPPNALERRAVNLFVGYDAQMPPFGRTRDISWTGCFVETRSRPNIGALVDIHIVWGDDAVSCTAQVVRHADEGVAMRFVEPGVWFMQCVREILEESPLLSERVSAGHVTDH